MVARLIAASANHDRLPIQRSIARRATSLSPTNAIANRGSGCPLAGGRSTKFGHAQYGHVSVRTPSKASAAPQLPHAKTTASAYNAPVRPVWLWLFAAGCDGVLHFEKVAGVDASTC